MRACITIILIFFTSLALSQNQWTKHFFSFPSNHTLNTRNLLRVQHNFWVDPFSEVPNSEVSGKHFGYEMTMIMGVNRAAFFYVAPSISAFPQLKDGYYDFVTSLGINWHMFHTTAVRYYAGGRLGLIRRGDVTFPLMGLSAGFDVTLVTFENRQGVSLYLGLEGFVDRRGDLMYGRYGGSYEGLIFTSDQVRENGRVKFGVRF